MSTAESGRAWLAGHLDQQEHVASGVIAAGIRAGFTEQTIRRAANALRVKRIVAKFGPNNVELWKLPPGAVAGYERRRAADAERHALLVEQAKAAR